MKFFDTADMNDLLDQIIAAAFANAPDLAEIADRNAIQIALGQLADLWQDSTGEFVPVGRCIKI